MKKFLLVFSLAVCTLFATASSLVHPENQSKENLAVKNEISVTLSCGIHETVVVQDGQTMSDLIEVVLILDYVYCGSSPM